MPSNDELAGAQSEVNKQLARLAQKQDARTTAQGEINREVTSSLGRHKTTLDSHGVRLTDVEKATAINVSSVSQLAGIVDAEVEELGKTNLRVTALKQNHDGTVERVDALEKRKNDPIDWVGAFTFAAIAAVISGICFYLLVFQANWDPFLMVQDGDIAAVKDKVYTILVYHVVAYTLVVTAAVFAVCVCTMSKPAAKPTKGKSDAKAKTDKPKAQTDDKTDKPKKPTPSAPTTGLKPPPGGRTLEQVYEDSK